MGRLEGEVIIIAGAAHGFREETARLAAREGARVLLADTAEAAIQAVAESIDATGGSACWTRLDLADKTGK